MRKFLLIGAGLAVLAGSGVALAQPPQGGPDARGGPENSGGPGPEMHPRWGMMHHHHHEDDENGAAVFRFRRGDAEMDIKCPADENVQACVAAAGTLMDKVAGMQQPRQQ